MVNKKDSELAVLAGVDIAPDDKVRMLDVSAGTAGSKEGTVAGLAQGLGLGKLVSSGYGGAPTWIDPAAADWAAVVSGDLGWIQFVYGADGSTVVMGHGATVEYTVEAVASPYGGANITFGPANFFWNEHWSGGVSDSGSGLNLASGVGASGAHVLAEGSPDRGWVEVQGVSGQTDPLADLKDGNGNSLFAVSEDGSVGGVTPTTTAFVIGWDGTKYVAVSLAAVYEAFGAAILKTFVNAKGDLLSASADNTPSIVTVGADDTILMADAAQTSGLKWVASATPSTQAIGDAAAVGTADTFTRGDHKHAMPVAADIYALAQSLNAQSGTTYTLVAGDAGKLVTLSNAGAITLTVPQDSAATFAVGAWVEGYQLGAGQVTVAAGTGATLRSTPTAKSRAQYSRFFLQKISANTWALSGDVAAT